MCRGPVGVLAIPRIAGDTGGGARHDAASEPGIVGGTVIGPLGVPVSPYRDFFHTGSVGECESLDFRFCGTGAGGVSSSSDSVRSMTARATCVPAPGVLC